MIDLDFTPLLGKKLLAAVSGGADSMCLLHLLAAAGLDVTAAHFEHGIRALWKPGAGSTASPAWPGTATPPATRSPTA